VKACPHEYKPMDCMGSESKEHASVGHVPQEAEGREALVGKWWWWWEVAEGLQKVGAPHPRTRGVLLTMDWGGLGGCGPVPADTPDEEGIPAHLACRRPSRHVEVYTRGAGEGWQRTDRARHHVALIGAMGLQGSHAKGVAAVNELCRRPGAREGR
jgi:hypothetical protein